MPKEILTLYTKLLVNRGAGDEELIDLLSTPDLGIGDPEKVEVTNLQDGTRRYVNGLKDVGDSLEFEFNYVTDNYQVLKEIEESKEIYTYKVVLPDKLCFTFKAALSVKITGAAVGEQVKMTINLTPYSTIEVGPYDDNAGQQSRYSTFTIGQSRARSAGTLKLYSNAEQPIEELYINDVAQELPTGVIQDWDDTAATNYEVNPGDVVKIKGGFSLYGTELPIEDVVLQNDLTDCEGMFSECAGLMVAPEIPEGVTNCSSMFDYSGLTQAPIIPSSVTDCSYMFSECTGLMVAPVIPEGVTNCSCMFFGCTGLAVAPEIPEGVTNCNGMFDNCTSLTEAPIIPTTVTDCGHMFYGCTGLTEAPVIPSSVTNCEYMFNGCSNLTGAPAIPEGVTNCEWMFSGCTSLTEAPIIPTTVTDCGHMFYGCTNLAVIPQENIDLMNNPPEGLIFEGCYNECPLVADSIPTSWGGTKVEEPEEVPGEYTTFTAGESGTLYIGNMYHGITELYIDDVAQELPTGTSYFETSEYAVENGQKIKIKGEFSLYETTLLINDIILQNGLEDCSSMFYGCTGLTKVSVIPSTVTNCSEMFSGCSSLTQAPSIPNSVNMCSSMFSDCTSLTVAPVIPSSAMICDFMFSGCTNLTQAPVIPSSITSCVNMFSYCSSLTQAPQIPEGVSDCNNMFYGCSSLTVAPVIPSSVSDCSSMFSGCTSLTEAPVIPSSVNQCNSMFEECTSLTVAPVIPPTVRNCMRMFASCISLTTLPPENVRLMETAPTSLTSRGCYNSCRNINDPITYDQIPSTWR